ncbi:MAG TPA: N-acetylmuramoyl-L-alanine amidase, partial [Flavisolibacter sp.]|nr:N-acetylmuramoyl-L-alanine amidase [Flavisolibacter sp.]
MRSIALILFVFISYTGTAQPFYGRTTGRLPYLNYGLGEDRLGGAKMTYLDSNILVKVVDSVKADYKIQLSSSHFAYLPKNHFRRDTSIKIQPHYNTASWRIWGDDKHDFVSIALPEKLPYRVQQEINPSKIIVDIFGAVSNTNWITQLKTAKEIKNAWYEQLQDDVFRIHILLKHQQHWGHLLYYNKNALHIRIKRQPESLKIKNLKIAIDAGHGGVNTGATGITTQIKEKDYTLKMAQQLEKYLTSKKATVFMTRSEDVDINMIDRTLMLREQDPDILISIHLNSSSNQAIKGTSTYYRHIGFRPPSEKIL